MSVLCAYAEIFDAHSNIPGGVSVAVVDGTRDGEARSYGVAGRCTLSSGRCVVHIGDVSGRYDCVWMYPDVHVVS